MSLLNRFMTRATKEVAAHTAAITSAPAAAPVIQPYAMKRTGDDSAEILLYGDIVSSRPTDRRGDPIDGRYIILSEVLEDLKRVEDVAHLTIRIHSVGGNAYDSMVIHNRLRSMPAKVLVIVDGVAMSGGSLIMCAGDTVVVYLNSLVMLHKCQLSLFGSYNASALQKMVDSTDALDRSQAAIYHAKTGIDPQELMSMMEAETYMTGQEAVDKGFADELAEGSGGLEITASADRRTLFAGGRPVWATARKGGIPAAIPIVNPETSIPVTTNTPEPAQTGGQNGGNIMATTLEELRKENPALAEQLMTEAQAAASASGAAATAASPLASTPATVADPTPPATMVPADPVTTERKRIREIDALAGLFDTETISAAKYGDTACTAQEMVYRAAQNAAKQGRKFLTALETDTGASGAQEVGAAVSTDRVSEGENLTPAQLMAKGRADAKTLVKTEQEGK